MSTEQVSIEAPELELQDSELEQLQGSELEQSQVSKKKKDERSFKVKLDINGPLYGRYNGDSPYQAANKALSEIIRNRVKNNQNSEEEISFYLVETTKSSNKKVHQYLGKRMKLEEPVKYKVEIKLNGQPTGQVQVIQKEFKNVLRKVKKTTQKGGNQNNTQSLPVIISAHSTGDVSSVTINTNVQTL